MIFLTTGEKIRSLRKRFNMRQQELEDENITRAFISMIETGKRGLSKETAKIIADKLNNKAKQLGVPLEIDDNYLLRTPQEDAEIYCLNKLNNEPTRDEIEVIIGISREYSLTKVEAQAYKILGDYDFDSENYVNSFVSYMISLDLYKDTEDRRLLPYLYNKLGYCKIRQFEYIEAISFLNRASCYINLYNDNEIQKNLLYNLAVASKNLREFDKALDYIDKYLILCNEKSELKDYVYANVLKANCFFEKGSFEKSFSIFMSLIEKLNDKENTVIAYVFHNLALMYKEQENFDRSLEYFNKEENIAEEKALPIIYIQKAQIYIKRKKYDEALRLTNLGLSLVVNYNDVDVILNGCKTLVHIYSFFKDFHGLKNTYMRILDLLKDKEYYKYDINKVYNRLALLYLEQSDIEMCKKYLNLAS